MSPGPSAFIYDSPLVDKGFHFNRPWMLTKQSHLKGHLVPELLIPSVVLREEMESCDLFPATLDSIKSSGDMIKKSTKRGVFS